MKILYIDMDNTRGLRGEARRHRPDVARGVQGREDELPGLFALMPRWPVHWMRSRSCPRSSTPTSCPRLPGRNPSAWQHKVEWVHLHLGIDEGTPAYKRLILSHHKNLNKGDFLVDDRPTKEGSRLRGEVIAFGSDDFPDWPTVTAYLRGRRPRHSDRITPDGEGDFGRNASQSASLTPSLVEVPSSTARPRGGRSHMSSGPTPSPDGDGVTPNSSEAPSKPTRSRMARILFNKRVVKAVGIVLMIGLLYYAIFVVLPSEIDWSQVWSDIQALTPLQIVGLVAGGLLAMVTLGWTSKASLPKLTLFQGFESSATSQLQCVRLPATGRHGHPIRHVPHVRIHR